MRSKIIAGNWKMNNNRHQASVLIKEILPLVKGSKAIIVMCTPYTDLETVKNMIVGSNIKLGAQNVSFATSGAYTGEISADMLVEIGVEYVIIGHSERRQYFAETDDTVNKRVLQALQNRLIPIICIGESEQERLASKTNAVCEAQIRGAFVNVSKDYASKCIVAYEPIWAIGTGKTATADEANNTIKHIRSIIGQVYNKDVANDVIIQYGGSMNASNAKELLSKSDIDGGLIGGASLKANEFSSIVNSI